MADTRSHDDDDGERPHDTAPTVAASERRVVIGDCLGRYTVRGLLGAGGMGEVFEGYDPELERRVALKVLKVGFGGTSPEARARFQREAQAMARLNHPNVVAVYDVGTVYDQVFVAMELVHGPTLAQWIAGGPRSWREVVDVFMPAGRGLEAAHAAGIVHRDFKPRNVILGDRVRVADFGLARSFGEVETGTPPAPTVLDHTVTQTGATLGTPAYMAPEQRDGGVVTAQADQHAFCVALAEALVGARVPRFLAALIARGQKADPEARFPSMTALLVELGRDRTRARRRFLLVAAAVVLVATGFVVRQKTTASPCSGAGARLGGIWDAPRKEALRVAFAATHLPFGDDTWRRVSARLDDYASGWTAMADETCRATRVEGRQSDTLMDLRMACLERRRDVLKALVDLWGRGVDAETLVAAGDAARGLAPVVECAEGRLLTERLPLPTAATQVTRIAAARAQLDGVQALILAHRLAAARDALKPARAAADATGWPEVQAEAAFAEADVLHQLADPGAQKPFLEAHRLAGAARDDRLAARALIELVQSLAVDDQHAEQALVVADIAEGAVARAGDEAGLRAQLLANRGAALYTQVQYKAAHDAFARAQPYFVAAFGAHDSATLWNEAETARAYGIQGHYVEARSLLEQNLATTIAVLGEEDPTVASKLNNLGLVARLQGDEKGAVDYFRRALALKERVGGADTPWMAMGLSNLGTIEMELGHLDAAQPLLERALALRERLLGPGHALVAMTLAQNASLRRKQTRFAEALDLLQRALAIEIKVYGPTSGAVGSQLVNIADVYATSGDPSAALGYYRRALESDERLHGESYPETLHLMSRVSEMLAELHRCDEARPLVDKATAGLEKLVGADHPYVGEALAARAACDLATGKAAGSVAPLERAIAIEEKSDGELIDRGIYRARLARALWAVGRREAALAAARKAEHELAGDADGQLYRVALRAWLAPRRAD